MANKKAILDFKEPSKTMRFTVILATTFAAIAVAIPHSDQSLEARAIPCCLTHQDCRDAGCGPRSECRGMGYNGQVYNVCIKILGQGGQAQIFTICDV